LRCVPKISQEVSWGCEPADFQHLPKVCPPNSRQPLDPAFFTVRSANSARNALENVVREELFFRGVVGTAEWFSCQGFPLELRWRDSCSSATCKRALSSLRVTLFRKSFSVNQLESELGHWEDTLDCLVEVLGKKLLCENPSQLRIAVDFLPSGRIEQVRVETYWKP
jgi:hypothetical protein